MADNKDEPKGEIPTFRITEKKVDDSWKEEVRREREAAKGVGATHPGTQKAPQSDTGAAGSAQPARPAGSDAAPAPSSEAGGTPKAGSRQPAKASPEQQTKIFMTFLAGLAQQALMQIGEIENPYTGQRELDLQGARYTIELLATIQAKTKGNLTEDEEGSLADTIHDLKMRYIEVVNEVQRQQAARAPAKGPAK
jgi:hypothetical protein